MSRFVDLSHPITDGLVTYPGLPTPSIDAHTTREESAARLGTGVSFHIGRMALVANTGTYVDSPFHFHADRADVAELPPERLVDVPIEVVRAVNAERVTAVDLGDTSRLWGRAVLVHTGWARHWGTERYLSGSPYLTADAVRALVEANVAVVGVDCLNIDDVTDLGRPAHHGLLGNDIPILEHLTNLDALPDSGARLYALPAPVAGMGSFPVRAVAALPA